jgi:hypothetical protein
MATNVVKEIRKSAHRCFSPCEKTRIVLERLRGEILVTGLYRPMMFILEDEI